MVKRTNAVAEGPFHLAFMAAVLVVVTACGDGREQPDASAVDEPAFTESGGLVRASVGAQRLTVESSGALTIAHVNRGARFRLLGADVRAGDTICDSTEPWKRHGDMLSRGRRCAVTDQLRLHSDGFQQLWRFEHRPATGALRVRVGVAGGRLMGSGARGLRFQDADAQLVYGHGTWIDAQGTRTAIPSRFVGGAIVLEVPDDVVARSAFPAVLDPIITAETGIDSPTPTRASGVQWDTRMGVDSDSSTHLVMWRDTAHPSGRRLFAARLDASGTVLDPYGLDVAQPATYANLEFRVASGGGEHFLVWGHRVSSSEEVVYGRRVDAVTGVLGPELELRRSGDIYASKVAVATNGTVRVMVWADRGDRIVASTFDETGSVSVPVVLSSAATAYHGVPAVHWTGSDFLVAWTRTSGGAIDGRRLDATGAPMGTSPFIIREGIAAGSLWLAGGPSQQALVYQSRSAVGAYGVDIHAMLIDGETASAPSVVIQEVDDQGPPRVSWDGTRYWVATNDYPGERVLVARVGSDGVLIDTTPITVATGRYQEMLGLGGPTPLIALSDGLLQARFLDPVTGAPGPELPVFLTGAQEWFPQVVAGVDEYLVAWSDYRDPATAPDVYAARFDAAGQPIGTAFPIAATAASEATGPLGFDGSHYVVAWSHTAGGERDIRGARVARDGTVLDPGGTALVSVAGSSQTPSAWSYDGTHMLLSWTDWRGDGRYADCYMGRFDGSLGALDGSGVAITSNQRCGYVSGAAAVPGTHFVVWQLYVPLSTRVEARGSRVRGGALLDGDGLVLGDDRPMGVATDGYRFATVVVENDAQLYSVMVNPATGAFERHRFLVDSARYLTSGSLVHDGAEYAFIQRVSNGGADVRIAGLTLDADGRLADPSYDISTGGDYPTAFPGLASLGAGTSLVAYSRYVYGAPYETYRVRALTASSERGLNGAPCTADADCGSGLCVDGVCCNAPCGGGATDDCVACSVAEGASEDGVCAPIAGGSVCGGPTTCMPTECNGTGSCAPVAGPDCDDSDPCTVDSCVDPRGCVHEVASECLDMGPPDLGPPDLGPPDLGPPDSGPPDLGPPDFGPPDLGPPDLGPPDFGAPDLGRDLGPLDGGVGYRRRSGCGCAAVGRRDLGGLVPFVVVLGLIGRRRRKGAR